MADEVNRYLEGPSVHVFSDLHPEPSEAQIQAFEVLGEFDADCIVAVGGGSVLDAGKAMPLFHESPDVSLLAAGTALPRRPEAGRPLPGGRAHVRLLALPTTARTGSSPPATVISAGGRKVTLVDYSLVPDVAIVDPTLTLTMPPSVTADTGVDALTHALEAGVSIFASPYTDAFCMQAINLIMEALPGACENGARLEGAHGCRTRRRSPASPSRTPSSG